MDLINFPNTTLISELDWIINLWDSDFFHQASDFHNLQTGKFHSAQESELTLTTVHRASKTKNICLEINAFLLIESEILFIISMLPK